MPENPDVPAEFCARTRYRYVVFAFRPPSTRDVPAVDAICEKVLLVAPCARSTRYWLTVPDEAPQFSDTEFAFVVQLGVPGVPGTCCCCVPPLTLCENELTVRPTPPIHGSKPACTLVNHQLLFPYWEPRVNVSRMKSMTSKLKLFSGEPWNRYETTL